MGKFLRLKFELFRKSDIAKLAITEKRILNCREAKENVC